MGFFNLKGGGDCVMKLQLHPEMHIIVMYFCKQKNRIIA